MPLESVSIVQRLSWIANIVYHQAKAVLIVYIFNTILAHYDIDSSGTWHMIITPLGFLLFLLEGLILYTDNNFYSISLHRTKKNLIHKILAGVGSILITVGISLMISAKSSHFTTAHGIVGLTMLILIWLAAILGILVEQAPKLKVISPIWIKLTHFLLGVGVVCLGVTALGLGMYKEGFRMISNDNTVVAGISICAILGVWALYDTAKSIYYLFV